VVGVEDVAAKTVGVEGVVARAGIEKREMVKVKAGPMGSRRLVRRENALSSPMVVRILV
jgi:hypothetical protein